VSKINAVTNTNAAQHEDMANKYVYAMASALQEYNANYLINYQVYKDLAWGGLSEAPVFDAKYPVGNLNRQRILHRYEAEQKGSNSGQGTPQEQTPLGKPCN
jgi:hypothetical protein